MPIFSYFQVYSVFRVSLLSSALVAVLFIILRLIQRYFLIGVYKKWSNLPPGPPSNFITGTPGYPWDKPHLWFGELSKTYGQIFTVWEGQYPRIILNSPGVIKELCDKRGGIYNGRPDMRSFHEGIFSGMSIINLGYDDAWRKMRRIFNSVSGATATKNLIPYIDYESKQYVYDLLNSPSEFSIHAERFAASNLTATIYGMRADDINDPSALGLLLFGNWLEANFRPMRYVEDRWPILRNIPRMLAPWRAKLERENKILKKIARAWWDPAKANVERGSAPPCFTTNFIKTYQQENYTEDEAAIISLGLMLAGSGTTSASENFLIMGLALNPHVVLKAHEELDRVVGPGRLPTLEDEPNLQYIRAIIKEALRWRPFSNQGFYHATTKDDSYNGYSIPEGTTVIVNAYSVHHDEQRWKDHDTFDPMRYIDYPLSALAYANLPDPNGRDHFAYGAGRRICVGISLAEPALFLLTSRLLWGFNVTQSKDQNGNPIPIDTLGYAGGTLGKPYPFNADIRVRSDNHAAVIRQEFARTESNVRTLAEATQAGDLTGMEVLVDELLEHPDVISFTPPDILKAAREKRKAW